MYITLKDTHCISQKTWSADITKTC